jgi:hypothetical protein
MAIRSNYASFRNTLHNENPPCIPYIGLFLFQLSFFFCSSHSFPVNLHFHFTSIILLQHPGVYLTDLTFIEDGIPDKLNGSLINFAKRRKISVVIREIQQYQQTPYQFHRVETIANLIDDITFLDSTECFQLSLAHEPRQPKK